MLFSLQDIGELEKLDALVNMIELSVVNNAVSIFSFSVMLVWHCGTQCPMCPEIITVPVLLTIGQVTWNFGWKQEKFDVCCYGRERLVWRCVCLLLLLLIINALVMESMQGSHAEVKARSISLVLLVT
jgi:hypothetical protein